MVRADFDGDGFQDLAVGAPGESVGSVRDAGTVIVLYGTAGGLTGPGSQLFNQASPGIASDPEPSDRFGSAIVAGDFDHDGFTDLAVATEQESVGRVPGAGVVQVLGGSPTGLQSIGSLLLTQDSPGVTSAVEPSDAFGSALAAGDFNADGVDDLAVGARGESVGTVEQAGAAFVLYGSGGGPTGIASTLLTQRGAAVPSEPEPLDLFGATLAAGDFDGSGNDDLAVGVPGESAGNDELAGAVNIFDSVPGRPTTGNRIFTEDVAGLAAGAEPGDAFGAALASGDVNADGYNDLVVGAPGEDLGTTGGEDAGTVFVLTGSPFGLSGTGSRRFDQNTAGIPDQIEASDSFGAALAVGDLDDNETDDVAIGVPGESVGDAAFAGAVCVLYTPDYGAPFTIDARLITQDTPGLGETAEPVDQFGLALAAGDFDANGITDMAIGAPLETVGAVSNAGILHTLQGTIDGLNPTDGRTFTQDSPGIASTAESSDTFGASLAATTSGPSGQAPG